MAPDNVLPILKGLRALPFFPAEEEVLEVLTSMAMKMAENEEQLRWVVKRMTCDGLYREWPGPAEVRGVFCWKYKPKDGIEADSAIYPEGPPVEPGYLPLLQNPALPPGHIASADEEADAIIQALAEKLAAAKKYPPRKKQQLSTAQFEARIR